MTVRYKRSGPGQQVCLLCSTRISTNALAVRGHERGKVHQAALEKESARYNAEQAARTAARARRGLEGLPTPEEKAIVAADTAARLPTRHGDERNRRTVTDTYPTDMVTADGTPVALGSSWTREVMERWCERCEEWVVCDGIVATLAFAFLHPAEPHQKPPAKPAT